MVHVTEEKKLVVIGAGFGGSRVYRGFKKAKGWKVTVIDAKEYFEVVPAALRSIVEPSTFASTITPHPAGTIVGYVTDITEGPEGNKVTLKDGRTFPFDVAVVATGSVYADAIKVNPTNETGKTSEGRKKEVEAIATLLKAAPHVTIIGGGVTAVELAGEILHYHSGKKLTIVTGNSGLLPGYPAKFSEYSTKSLTSSGAQLVSERSAAIEQAGSGYVVKTESGVEIATDLVITATGLEPASTFFNISTASGPLKFSHGIEVDRTMKIKGASSIYAIGDTVKVDTGSEGFFGSGNVAAANLGARVAVANILGTGSKPVLFPQMLPAMGFVSIGPKDGVGMNAKGKFTLGKKVAKQKDMATGINLGVIQGKWFPNMIYTKVVEGIFGNPVSE